jgi:hypothetical protein
LPFLDVCTRRNNFAYDVLRQEMMRDVAQVIIVEWNPFKDAQPLADALR